MSHRDQFADHEWRTLQFVPLAAYYAVGYADGSVSAAETAEYLRKLGQVAGLTAPGTELAREVFESVAADHDNVQRRYDDARMGGLSVELVLAEAARLLDRVEAAQATAFRHVIHVLCRAVADASPIIGEKVTAQEQQAIDAVVAQLASPNP